MHRFRFEFNSDTDEENSYKTTMEFTSENWFTALDQFILFLRGVGFNIPDRTVAVDTVAFPFIPDDIYSVGVFNSENTDTDKTDVEFSSLP